MWVLDCGNMKCPSRNAHLHQIEMETHNYSTTIQHCDQLHTNYLVSPATTTQPPTSLTSTPPANRILLHSFHTCIYTSIAFIALHLSYQHYPSCSPTPYTICNSHKQFSYGKMPSVTHNSRNISQSKKGLNQDHCCLFTTPTSHHH